MLLARIHSYKTAQTRTDTTYNGLNCYFISLCHSRKKLHITIFVIAKEKFKKRIFVH